MLIVYLLEELSKEEQQLLAGTVDGEVAGFINGALKVLQIRVPETDLAGLQKQAETLMQEEKVLYATADGSGESFCREQADENLEEKGLVGRCDRCLVSLGKGRPICQSGQGGGHRQWFFSGS